MNDEQVKAKNELAVAIGDHLTDGRWPTGEPVIKLAKGHVWRVADPLATALYAAGWRRVEDPS